MMEGGHSQGRQHQGNFFHQPRLPYYQIKPNYYKPHHRQHGHRDHGPTNATTFDTKRLKNNLLRRTVDYNASIIRYLQTRVWQRDYRDTRWIQPDFAYVGDLNLPHALLDNPINAVTTRFVRTSTNKVRCPIFCVVWTPEGRRLVTGASSGEFTLWNGLTFNFETILQAHEYAVRTMTWSHNDMWLLTGDDLGYVKYWQSNMNNVQMYQAHKNQAVRCARYNTTCSLLDLLHSMGEKLICSYVTREKYTEICHFASVEYIVCLSIVFTICLVAWMIELCQAYYWCTIFHCDIIFIVILYTANCKEGICGTWRKAVDACLENFACRCLTRYICCILTSAMITFISAVRNRPLLVKTVNKNG